MAEMASPDAAQPPFGSSSATGPTPNQGYEAAGMQRLGVIVKGMGELIPLLGASSDAGQAVLKALTSLAKFVPPGAVTPAAERNINEQQMFKNVQQAQMLQQLRARAAMGGQGGAPGGAPGGQPAPGPAQAAA